MKIYRIRDKVTGLFSPGGMDASSDYCKWSKTGKVWNGIGPLRSHLNLFLDDDRGRGSGIPATWEVIEYELVETEVSIKPVHEILSPNQLVRIIKK